eukprot:COSAG02_NODE_350_length_24063_cov_47.131447_17_plen_906_part_00
MTSVVPDAADGGTVLIDELLQPLEAWLALYRGTSDGQAVDVAVGEARTLRSLVNNGLTGADLDTELKSLGLLKMKGRKAAHMAIAQYRSRAQINVPARQPDSKNPHVAQSSVDPRAPEIAGTSLHELSVNPDGQGASRPLPSNHAKASSANFESAAQAESSSRDDEDSQTPTTTTPRSLQGRTTSKREKDTAELRFGNIVPHDVLTAFEKWTESGVRPSTHSAYVKSARTLFEFGVEKYGLKEGSTLQEARAQLRATGKSVDKHGFLKASLTNLMKFLDSGVNSGGASGGGTKRRREQPSKGEGERVRSKSDKSGKSGKSGKVGKAGAEAKVGPVPEWNCGKCTALNAASDTRCHVCLGYRARHPVVSPRTGESSSIEQQSVSRPDTNTSKLKVPGQGGSSSKQTNSLPEKPARKAPAVSNRSLGGSSRKQTRNLPKQPGHKATAIPNRLSAASGTRQTKSLPKHSPRKAPAASKRLTVNRPVKDTTELRFGNIVPHDVLTAFEKWTESGVRPSTHSAYVKSARTLFEFGVEKYGLKEGSTLQEARAQLRATGKSVDKHGFLKASLTNLMKFLDSGVNSGGASGGGTKRRREQPSKGEGERVRSKSGEVGTAPTESNAGKSSKNRGASKVSNGRPSQKKSVIVAVNEKKCNAKGQPARKSTSRLKHDEMDSPSSNSCHCSEGEGKGESDDDDYSRPLERTLSVTRGASALIGLFQTAGEDTLQGAIEPRTTTHGAGIDQTGQNQIDRAKSVGASIWDTEKGVSNGVDSIGNPASTMPQVVVSTNEQQHLLHGSPIEHSATTDAGTVDKPATNWTNGAAGEDVRATEQNTVSPALLADQNASEERTFIIDAVLPVLRIAANQGQSPEADLSSGQQTAGREDDQLANYHLAMTSRTTSSRDELTEWT